MSVSVHLTQDLSLLRRLVQDPEIRASMGDDTTPDEIDVGAFVPENARVYEVSLDDAPAGVFVLLPQEPGFFEVHTILGKNCRGKPAVDAARQMIDDAFKRGAVGLRSKVFNDAPAVRWFARHVGFKEVGQHLYPHTRNGRPVEIVDLLLTR